MNNWTPSPDFEERIRQSFEVPEIRPEFVDRVYADLMRKAVEKPENNYFGFKLRPVWLLLFILLIVSITGTLIIGPQKVLAAVGRLFGYIPGVGIVDDSAPIRVLAEPVSVTRDGVTITVTSATLTADRTHIDYRIFGVPGSAYPDREDIVGCSSREYLRLGNGILLAQINDGYEPVPSNENNAVFVIPCIANTLPGKTPENWELPLRFIPAPPNLTILPLTNVTPASTKTSTQINPVTVSVEKAIETIDGYILLGALHPRLGNGQSISITGAPIIHDANNKKVAYTFPQDIDESQVLNLGIGDQGFSLQFKAAGVIFPLTIEIPGKIISPSNSNGTAEIYFDAGTNPQQGQEWTLNQKINLDGYTLTLVSISADSRNGFGFRFETEGNISSLNISIDGYTPMGGGGGGDDQGMINQSLAFTEIPKGNLKVVFSDLMLASETQFWQSQWSPATPHTGLSSNPSPQPGLCLNTDLLSKLTPSASIFFNGKILLYEQLANSDQWGLVLYNLDGSQKQVIALDASRGTLSLDGSRLAYPYSDGIHILDLTTKIEKVLTGIVGFNLQWSPDGNEIAYIGMGDGIVDSLFVVNVENGQARKISDWSYESVIGWSKDSSKLYFVAPFTGGAAWKVFSFDMDSGAVKELFTIENGTPKFLNPKLSPDGEWIAYRGRDNSSVYLVHPDGSGMHLLIDNTGAVGIEWSVSGWLGVSLRKPNSEKSTVVLIKPDSCDVYQLPDSLHGDLEGLFIP